MPAICWADRSLRVWAMVATILIWVYMMSRWNVVDLAVGRP